VRTRCGWPTDEKRVAPGRAAIAGQVEPYLTGRFYLAVAAASVLGQSVRPAAGHRHTILAITTPNRPDGFWGHRGKFGSRGAPGGTR
jgi:hypothetical protein